MHFKTILTIVYVCLSCNYLNALSELFTFEPPNLKTVLFKESDLMHRCWSTHEVNLLLNRRIMQDLIPRKIPKDLPLLLRYLKNVEDFTKEVPPGINKTLVTQAIGDVIGGYLQAIVIPIANEAYYAGNVDYMTVSELHKMLGKWKWYLSSDGGTWSQECDMHKIPTKVTTIDISLHDKEAACQELYVGSSPQINETDFLGSQTVISESSRVAIPYLDNNLLPNAIALPFKKRNLYSLKDPRSAYILVKYYTLTMRCLAGSENDILAFNNYFHLWIVSKVVPHLHDQDNWYPAFGAVMRVVETIKQKGLASANPVFVPPLNEDHQDAALNTNLDVGSEESSSKQGGTLASYFNVFENPYTVLIVLGAILVLMIVLVCVCLLCWRYQRRKSTIFLSDISDDNTLKNALLSLYCGLKGSQGNSGTKLVPDKEKSTTTQEPSYPHNTPASSDIALSLTSESDEDYSSSSKSTYSKSTR